MLDMYGDIYSTVKYIPGYMDLIFKGAVQDRNNLSFMFQTIGNDISKIMYYYEDTLQRFYKKDIKYNIAKTLFNKQRCMPGIIKDIDDGFDITMRNFVDEYINDDDKDYFKPIMELNNTLMKPGLGIQKRDSNLGSRMKKRNKNFNKLLRETLKIKDDSQWTSLKADKRNIIASKGLELTPEQLIALDFVKSSKQ